MGCPVCGGVQLPCANRWCGRADRWFSVVYPCGAYEGALRHGLVRYKYRGERWWAPVFASMIADLLAAQPTWFEEFDVIVGVPAYVGPGSRRRWDPVGGVLETLTSKLDPGWFVAPGAVVKRAETPPMQGRPWVARQAVAAGPLRRCLHVPDPAVLDGARVLVVDDIMTEGSTINEVARAVRRAGALEAAGLVVARLPWPRAT